MAYIHIDITLSGALSEVGRITNYTGRKKNSGSEYELISTTESDHEMLLKYWEEACDVVTENVRHFITEQTYVQSTYSVTISPSVSFDTTLEDSFKRNIECYVVKYIVSKWYKLLDNNEEYTAYEKEANSHLNEAMRKLYFKKKPTRRQINN